MIFILCILAARVLYLTEQFYEQDNKQDYIVSKSISAVPFFFESMCILYICRFKSHIIHIHKRSQASLKTRVLFFMVFVANGFLIFFSPVIKCMDISDNWALIVNVSVLSVYFLFLSIFSLVLCKRLLALMNFGNLKQKRSRLVKLEILIQLTLAYNCLLAYKWDDEAKTPIRIGIEAGYYILSELIPFIAVSIAFFYQMGIYR